MVDDHEDGWAGDPPVGDATPTWRVAIRTFRRAWWLTVLGGGWCGIFSFSWYSIVAFPLAASAGMVLGAIVGIPLGLALVVWVLVSRDRSTDPAHVYGVLGTVGLSMALVTTLPTNLATLRAALGDHPVESAPLALAAILATIGGIVGNAFVGRSCGRVLADRVVDDRRVRARRPRRGHPARDRSRSLAPTR